MNNFNYNCCNYSDDTEGTGDARGAVLASPTSSLYVDFFYFLDPIV
jgi:hypothetical protein